MALIHPKAGLVISYNYLWHREHRSGREEGAKSRPCVIVLAVAHRDGETIVTVAPVTHSAPSGRPALELPLRVKEHLGLDGERSWVILDEVNRFAWPGFDLRPIGRVKAKVDYGMLPPKLHQRIVDGIYRVWRGGGGRAVPRG